MGDGSVSLARLACVAESISVSGTANTSWPAHAMAFVRGGALSLHDRQPHGLVVRMRLPVRQQSERSAA
jgi:hypothetical protein